MRLLRGLRTEKFTKNNLRWGEYQKYATPDPLEDKHWNKNAKMFQNWEAAVEEAREDLAKLPVDPDVPGPDPDKPYEPASNLLDHLDTAVKIALFKNISFLILSQGSPFRSK